MQKNMTVQEIKDYLSSELRAAHWQYMDALIEYDKEDPSSIMYKRKAGDLYYYVTMICNDLGIKE